MPSTHLLIIGDRAALRLGDDRVANDVPGGAVPPGDVLTAWSFLVRGCDVSGFERGGHEGAFSRAAAARSGS